MAVHTRIAPTPSGFLHAGNAFSFLYTSTLLKGKEDTLRLRIDDLDGPRMRRDYLKDIFETLEWLGIHPQLGPHNPEYFKRHHTQALRLPVYQEYIEQLKESGYLYACNCSRKQIQQISAKGVYPGTCRLKKLPLDLTGTALRLRIPDELVSVTFSDEHTRKTVTIDLSEAMGDFIIQRKDGLPSYQLASFSDDIFYGINTVVRGEDLLNSTAAQLLLAQLLELRTFEQIRFYHHPLLLNKGREKLSKSAGHLSLKHLRKTGMSAQQVTALFENWLQEIS